jgi:hypothetical protein
LPSRTLLWLPLLGLLLPLLPPPLLLLLNWRVDLSTLPPLICSSLWLLCLLVLPPRRPGPPPAVAPAPARLTWRRRQRRCHAPIAEVRASGPAPGRLRAWAPPLLARACGPARAGGGLQQPV